MSDYRDSLDDRARSVYSEAVSSAGQLLAAWRSQATHEGQPLTERAA